MVPLGDVGGTFAGASWGEDGSIFVSDASGRAWCGFPPAEARPRQSRNWATEKLPLLSRRFCPEAKRPVCGLHGGGRRIQTTIEVLTLADRHRKIVARGGTSPRYLATSNGAGHLVYVNKATLFAIPFDLDKLETRGTAVPVLDDVAYQSRDRDRSI